MKHTKTPSKPTRIMPKRGRNRPPDTTEKSRSPSSGSDGPSRKRKKVAEMSQSETVKQLASSSGNGNTRSGSESPEQGCSICLGTIEDRSFTEACYHVFCFECLVEWSRVRAVCPLCKKAFTTIIHNFKSYDNYESYTVPVTGDASLLDHHFSDWHVGPHSNLPRPRAPSPAAINHDRMVAFRRCMYANPERMVFRGIWSSDGVIIQPHHISPTMFAAYPVMLERLRPWVLRDLGIVVGTAHTGRVAVIIMDLLKRFPITSEDFYERVFPYLGLHTRRFLQELDNFARSPFDVSTFDERAFYSSPSLGDHQREAHPLSSHIENISSSDDSDVEIVASDTVIDTPPSSRDISAPLLPSLMSSPLQFLTALMSRPITNLPGWESPIPGPSGIRFLWPRDDSDSVSSNTSRSELEDTSGRSEVSREHLAAVVSDDDSDVVVVDINQSRRSPIMLSSSSDDEVKALTAKPPEFRRHRRRKRRSDCRRTIPIRSENNLFDHNSRVIGSEIGEAYQSADLDVNPLDLSSTGAFNNEAASLLLQNMPDDNVALPSSSLQDSAGDSSKSDHLRNASSPSDQPSGSKEPSRSRCSSVEIVDDWQVDSCRPAKAKISGLPVVMAGSSDIVPASASERPPLRKKVKNKERKKDVADSLKSHLDDNERPTCKKHISGHKSSKKKFAEMESSQFVSSESCSTKNAALEDVNVKSQLGGAGSEKGSGDAVGCCDSSLPDTSKTVALCQMSSANGASLVAAFGDVSGCTQLDEPLASDSCSSKNISNPLVQDSVGGSQKFSDLLLDGLQNDNVSQSASCDANQTSQTTNHAGDGAQCSANDSLISSCHGSTSFAVNVDEKISDGDDVPKHIKQDAELGRSSRQMEAMDDLDDGLTTSLANSGTQFDYDSSVSQDMSKHCPSEVQDSHIAMAEQSVASEHCTKSCDSQHEGQCSSSQDNQPACSGSSSIAVNKGDVADGDMQANSCQAATGEQNCCSTLHVMLLKSDLEKVDHSSLAADEQNSDCPASTSDGCWLPLYSTKMVDCLSKHSPGPDSRNYDSYDASPSSTSDSRAPPAEQNRMTSDMVKADKKLMVSFPDSDTESYVDIDDESITDSPLGVESSDSEVEWLVNDTGTDGRQRCISVSSGCSSVIMSLNGSPSVMESVSVSDDDSDGLELLSDDDEELSPSNFRELFLCGHVESGAQASVSSSKVCSQPDFIENKNEEESCSAVLTSSVETFDRKEVGVDKVENLDMVEEAKFCSSPAVDQQFEHSVENVDIGNCSQTQLETDVQPPVTDCNNSICDGLSLMTSSNSSCHESSSTTVADEDYQLSKGVADQTLGLEDTLGAH